MSEVWLSSYRLSIEISPYSNQATVSQNIDRYPTQKGSHKYGSQSTVSRKKTTRFKNRKASKKSSFDSLMSRLHQEMSKNT